MNLSLLSMTKVSLPWLLMIGGHRLPNKVHGDNNFYSKYNLLLGSAFAVVILKLTYFFQVSLRIPRLSANANKPTCL